MKDSQMKQAFSDEFEMLKPEGVFKISGVAERQHRHSHITAIQLAEYDRQLVSHKQILYDDK